jgi:spermidine synthase
MFRELSIIFSGNELFIGLCLSTWLFSSGIGSFISANYLPKFNPRKTFIHIICIQSILFPAILSIIRIVKSLFMYGEIIGILQMVGITFFVLFPIGFLFGAQFTFAGELSRQKNEKFVIIIYMFETLGSLIGGALFSFLLAGNVWNVSLSFFCSIILLFCAIILSPSILPISLFILNILILLTGWDNKFDIFTRKLQWKNYGLVEQIESKYGHLAITKIGNIYSLYQDGEISASWRNVEKNEEVHWALLASKNPEDVLIFGNACSGPLYEIFKYNINQVDYVELDENVVKLTAKYLDPINKKILTNPKVKILNFDARVWIKNTPKKYDVIIINLPPPSTAQLNRLYTIEFFKEIKSKLKEDGIVSFSLPSGENYISPVFSLFNSSIYKSLKTVFPNVTFIPGDTILFLVSNSNEFINFDSSFFIKRLEERKIKNIYVTKHIIPFRLSKERIDYTLKQLNIPAKLNSDFHPISYYYYFRVWMSQFYSKIYFLFLLGGIILIIFGIRKLKEMKVLVPIPIILFTLGFSGMILEVVLLLSFQSIFGYIYQKMGILFSAFMFGLAIGSTVGYKVKKVNNAILITIISMAMLILFTQFLFQTLINELYFYLLLIMDGLIIGFAFAISSIAFREFKSFWGILYGADLFGSCLGALICSSFLIPLFGITTTCIVAFTSIIAILVIALRLNRSSQV